MDATILTGKTIHVFAPATVANVGSGFDIFGFALHEPGDEVSLEVTEKPGVIIKSISGDDGILPMEAEKNTSGRSVNAMLQYLKADFGVSLDLHKKMPIRSGLGSSAASSVASVFAFNSLLKKPLPKEKLLEFAAFGEKIASGDNVHFDNIAACLYGGFILVRSKDPVDIISIPAPEDLYCTIVHPKIAIDTSETRKMLKTQVLLSKAVTQWANVAGVVTALFNKDYSLLKRSLIDEIVEPDRSILIPYYQEMKETAQKNDAIGFNISGSGPSVFALSSDINNAEKIADAVKRLLDSKEVDNDIYISKINQEGPKIIN
jgi:homoserine kinase